MLLSDWMMDSVDRYTLSLRIGTMTKMGFLRDFQGVIGRFLREFVAIAGFIIFFDYKVAEKSLGYLCTERDFWGVYRGILGDSRTQKPRAAVSVPYMLR